MNKINQEVKKQITDKIKAERSNICNQLGCERKPLRNANPMAKFAWYMFLENAVIWGMMSWAWLFLYPVNDTDDIPTYSQYMQDVYNPFAGDERHELCVNDDGVRRERVTKNEQPGKFAPNPLWGVNIGFVLLSAFFSGLAVGCSDNDRDLITKRMITNAKNIKKHKMVDTMLLAKYFGDKYNLDTKETEKLVEKFPEVIKAMSKQDEKYFEMLVNGDIKINDEKTYNDMAWAIIKGYLPGKSVDKAKLIADKLGPKFGLPEIATQMYKEYTK